VFATGTTSSWHPDQNDCKLNQGLDTRRCNRSIAEEFQPMRSSHSIAQGLPDLPRWVEARDLLLRGCCEIFGLQEEPELSLVLRDPVTESVFVIGTPAVTAVQAAVQQNVRDGSVIAPPEQAIWLTQALPEWTRTRAILHLLRDPQRLPIASAGEVGFLDPARLDRLPIAADLLWELQLGAEHSLIAATFVEQMPVSFCYAGAVTESLWDISIDTLPEYRRRGYAALCVAHMIRHMQAQGKQPVWGALEENPASWRLAQKLGFAPVDDIVLFEPRKQPTLSTQKPDA
jgi:RimJ/RimL family protein N-acetyltransferase